MVIKKFIINSGYVCGEMVRLGPLYGFTKITDLLQSVYQNVSVYGLRW